MSEDNLAYKKGSYADYHRNKKLSPEEYVEKYNKMYDWR